MSDQNKHEGKISDCAYSIFCLEQVIGDVRRQANMVQRLEAELESRKYALEAEEYA